MLLKISFAENGAENEVGPFAMRSVYHRSLF